MKKRCFALFLAVIVAFGGLGLRPQKAYAFAFAPAMVPLVVSLLGMAGIFVTGVYSNDDLTAKMEDFVLSDGAVAEFIEELFMQISGGAGSAIVFTGKALTFLVDVFIDYARGYFTESASDAFIEGKILRHADELLNVNLRFLPSTVMSGFNVGSYDSSVLVNFIKDDVYYSKHTYTDSSGVSKVTERSEELSADLLDCIDSAYFRFFVISSSSTSIMYKMAFYSSDGTQVFKPRSFSNTMGQHFANVLTLGNISYMTSSYASEKGLVLTSGYTIDSSVSVPALKQGLTDAESVTLLPVSSPAEIYSLNGSVVSAYDGTLVSGVVLDPDVVNPDVPLDPPVTGDLTGISGLLKKIWEWLQGCLDDLIAALTALLTFLFVPTAADFQASFNPFLSSIQSHFDLDAYQELVEGLNTLKSPYPPNITAVIFGKTYTVVDFKFFNEYRETFFSWTRGVFFALLFIYNLNFIYQVIRASSLTTGSGSNPSSGSGSGPKPKASKADVEFEF